MHSGSFLVFSVTDAVLHVLEQLGTCSDTMTQWQIPSCVQGQTMNRLPHVHALPAEMPCQVFTGAII
uniref:Secreted protein n=1 Tax=Anguilla anguilla TaxID=7936 RepID=A0A0E9P530_ANGAN